MLETSVKLMGKAWTARMLHELRSRAPVGGRNASAYVRERLTAALLHQAPAAAPPPGAEPGPGPAVH